MVGLKLATFNFYQYPNKWQTFWSGVEIFGDLL